MSVDEKGLSPHKERRRYSSLSGEKYMVVWDAHKVRAFIQVSLLFSSQFC